MKKWKCMVCGYMHAGEEPPGSCPVCGASADKFEVIDDMELDDWVNNFRSKGASNWLNYDDPIAEWLKERQG